MHSPVAENKRHIFKFKSNSGTPGINVWLDREALGHLPWLQGVNILYRWTACGQHCMTVCCGHIKEGFVGIILTTNCVCSQQQAAPLMLLCAT